MSTFKDAFRIGQREIGTHVAPFIIAEMSGNHNQSLDRALQIVDAAAAAGAHALKLQTYTADTMTLDLNEREFQISDQKSLWHGNSLYELYEKAHTPWDWHKPIFDRCKKHGMIGFSTPFDETAVDFLESLNVPVYKIASFENTHKPLIQKVVKTGKPVIISTGMADLATLQDIVNWVKDAGGSELVLLKCTSTYPATPQETNLRTIPHMREMFGCQVGLSDHTMGVGCAVASVALGAPVIEKHFTLARKDGGVDSSFSLEPDELKSLVIESERVWQGLGQVKYERTANEERSIVFRRSIYVTKDIHAGEKFTKDNTRIIRPGLGLAPKHWDDVLESTAGCDLKRGTALQSNHISGRN